MKSARDRAEEAAEATRMGGGAGTLALLEMMFKEHARDQRHLCAESVLDRTFADSSYRVADAIHEAVLNAPAPGE